MKLTKEVKSDIIRSTIKAVFAERQEWIQKCEDTLALAVYNILYPANIQAKMNALPDTFFMQQTVVYVHFLATNRYRFALRLQSSKKISAADDRGCEKPCLELSESDPLIPKIELLRNDKEAIEKDKSALKARLTLLLAGINTKNQLKSEWPEGEVYYKDILPEEKTTNLPAIRGKEITEMIQKLK